jgi:hypothetical protein
MLADISSLQMWGFGMSLDPETLFIDTFTLRDLAHKVLGVKGCGCLSSPRQ